MISTTYTFPNLERLFAMSIKHGPINYFNTKLGMINSSTYNYLSSKETPFYYYNMDLLEEGLNMIKEEASKYNYHIHYAIKANANPRILSLIQSYGLGADCVSETK